MQTIVKSFIFIGTTFRGIPSKALYVDI